MRIESIEIRNFRQYQDSKIYFKRNPLTEDIHIILGENGEGKTNILNAITWCLYGEETHLGDKNTALPLINSHYVNDCKKIGKEHGDVSVKITISCDEGTVCFLRSSVFSFAGTQPIETENKLSVLVNNQKYYDNEDVVFSYVFHYLPQNINDYIFFDGEQLDDYFKQGKREKIELGIKDLTKASIVKKVIDGFKKHLSYQIKPALENADDNKVKAAQNKCDFLQTKKEKTEATIQELENQKKICIDELSLLEQIIHGHDNIKDKAILMENLEKNLESEQDLLSQKNSELMKFTREYFVYLSLYTPMKELYDFIQKQEKAGNLPPKVDKNLVESILTSKKCPICGSDHLDFDRLEHVKEVLKKLEISSATSNGLNKVQVAFVDYFKKLRSFPEVESKLKSEIKNVERNINRLEKDYKEVSDYMKQIADSDKITRAINDREQYLQLKESLIERLAVENHLLNQTELDIQVAENQLEGAMKQNSAYERLRKQKDFCDKSIKILSRTMEEVLNDCRVELQQSTFNLFQELMWKKDTFKRVEIDEDYVFHLINNFNQETLGSCSAAERGLLALSFTMALQEISHHDSLLYIDTPLGRVGNKNRINFSEILKKVGEKKQVILSFTPSEYDENVRNILTGHYSTFNTLDYKEGLTTIKKKV